MFHGPYTMGENNQVQSNFLKIEQFWCLKIIQISATRGHPSVRLVDTIAESILQVGVCGTRL